MPLSTIERPRLGATPMGAASMGGASAAYGYSGRSRSNIHTPPQTPPYHGTLNGANGAGGVSTLRSSAAGISPYGHLMHGPGAGHMPTHGHMACVDDEIRR